MKNKSKKKFRKTDFISAVWKTMKDQEKKNPALGILHERLDGNFRLLGLTGGIASGKSTVSDFFKKLRIPVIDADQMARESVKPNTKTYREILKTFGKEIVQKDRSLDRERLGEIVFSNPSKKEKLEKLTHPEIFKKILRKIREIKKQGYPLIVVDAALLFESGLHQQMDKTILIRTRPEIQRQRLMTRDGLSADQAGKRIQAQMPDSEREKLANYIIDNSGSPEETYRQLLEVITQII